MSSPRWRQKGTANHTVTCSSCGVQGIILQGTGGKEFRNVAGRYFCMKVICQAEANKPIQILVPVPVTEVDP